MVSPEYFIFVINLTVSCGGVVAELVELLISVGLLQTLLFPRTAIRPTDSGDETEMKTNKHPFYGCLIILFNGVKF